LSQTTPRNKDARAQGHHKGSKAGGGGCSLLRVWWWWMLTMKSHGVEISIARCVGEMVRDPNPMSFFYFVYFFFYHVLCIIQLLGTKTTCSTSNSKEKTRSPIFLQPGTREKAIKPSLSGTRPTAHRLRKTRNQTPTKGVE